MEKEIGKRSGSFGVSFAWALMFTAAALGLCATIVRRGNRLEQVRAHNAALSAKLGRLKQECSALERMAVALREEPVAVEREMRQTFGLVRDGEKTYSRVKVSFQRPARKRQPEPGIEQNTRRLMQALHMDSGDFRFAALSLIVGAMALVMFLSLYQAGRSGQRPVD